MTWYGTLFIAAFIWAECFDCAGFRWLVVHHRHWAYALTVAVLTLVALRLFTLAVMP